MESPNNKEQQKDNIVNGLNAGVSVVRMLWSSGWENFWKELLLVTKKSHQQQFFSELLLPEQSQHMKRTTSHKLRLEYWAGTSKIRPMCHGFEFISSTTL